MQGAAEYAAGHWDEAYVLMDVTGQSPPHDYELDVPRRVSPDRRRPLASRACST